jgi:hypothetical protein
VAHFAAVPVSVRAARRHAAGVVAAWGLGDRVEAVELLVSELATNSVHARPGADGVPTAAPGTRADRRERFAVRLSCTDANLVIEVWDGAAADPPVRKAHDPAADGGRGLLLVEALSDDRGYYRPRTGGKVTWCACTLAGSPPPSADGPEASSPLPRRNARASPEPGPPAVEMTYDLPLLRRVVDGLRALDSWHLPAHAADPNASR